MGMIGDFCVLLAEQFSLVARTLAGNDYYSLL
jgi:hypothetical protein